jgi:hypothetical protein
MLNMQGNTNNNNWSLSILDYKVANNDLIHINLQIWRSNPTFGHSEQASPISEGVAEIQINVQHCKRNNLTTRHMWVTKAPRVVTIRNDYQRVGPGPTSP